MQGAKHPLSDGKESSVPESKVISHTLRMDLGMSWIHIPVYK